VLIRLAATGKTSRLLEKGLIGARQVGKITTLC
jgi:hypothetical protein